ncbi:uncharacterized protein LOC142173453 [Nicotiana tabacum]|uniref:Uncharacterized protein LOC142173453 n=1 Tax=Nicotiana tabacum TaxID=4097 RepID=A0AC58TD65_TOBAC
MRGLVESPWAICGDFNVTRFSSEKRNCLRRSRAMVEFSDFIDDMNLIDLPLEGGFFTWFKGDNQIISSRIDRILISEEWDDTFRNIKQSLIQRLISDHVPSYNRRGIVKKASLLMEYEKHLKIEEIVWRQRSRSLWLKKGDMNTSFFYKTANAHKKSNNIDQLVIQEETIVEPQRIKTEIIDFYKEL